MPKWEKTGSSRTTTDLLSGELKTEHEDEAGRPLGVSRTNTDIFTLEQTTEHEDREHNRVGISRRTTDVISGEEIVQHATPVGEPLGESRETEAHSEGLPGIRRRRAEHWNAEGELTGESLEKPDPHFGEDETEHYGTGWLPGVR